MRFFVNFLVMAAIALGTGFGLSYFALTDGRMFGAYSWGAWITWPNIGAPMPDPYSRAVIARDNALQLGRGEGVRFVAQRDDKGEVLDLGCNYRITGATPIAAFWTLRAITADGTSAAPAPAPQSMRSDRLARDNDGIATIHVGQNVASGNWLEVEGSGRFEVVLTFYDASVFAGLGSNVDALPQIINEGCA